MNEAAIAWPPDPWRITRALLSVWHQKVMPDEVSRALLSRLLEALASELPGYELPQAVHTHTRHFMPTREGRTEKRTLVFDAFARFGTNSRLVAVWENVRLAPEEEKALDVLLERLTYLGRSESWVEASRLREWNGIINCRPRSETTESGQGEPRDVITMLAPRGPTDYSGLRDRILSDARERLRGARLDRLRRTLPDDWLESLETDSADLRAAGWSAPPAAREVHYLRPVTALEPVALPRVHYRRRSIRPTVARYAVYGKPLCRLEDAVYFGELLRRAVMGCAKRILGADHIPPILSGHGASDHSHAFFLPDAHANAGTRDAGRIHHAILFAAGGFDEDAVQVLDRLRQVVEPNGRTWQLVLEGIGDRDMFRSPLLEMATEWISVTPYLHPWHRKACFDVPEQIRRECRERGFPELLSLEPIAETRIGGRARRPVHFRRFRSKRGLPQPDRRGSFWRLRFAQPVAGPISLGFACHYGLGLFEPMRQIGRSQQIGSCAR